MGESKRRKQLDPNYGKTNSLEPPTHGYSCPVSAGKIFASCLFRSSQEIDKLAQKINKSVQDVHEKIPSGCNMMPMILNETIPIAFFTKSGFSRGVASLEEMPSDEIIQFLASGEINKAGLFLAEFLIKTGRIK